jgi:hypothetical protein
MGLSSMRKPCQTDATLLWHWDVLFMLFLNDHHGSLEMFCSLSERVFMSHPVDINEDK